MRGGTQRQALHLRVVARYKKAIEFDSPEEMQKYLKDHPGADRALHHVKPKAEKPQQTEKPKPQPPAAKPPAPEKSKSETKPEAKPPVAEKPKEHGEGGEHGGHGEHGENKPKEPKKTFKQRLEGLSKGAKSFVSNLKGDFKSFVSDDAFRRKTMVKMSEVVADLPEKTWNNAKKAVKHEAHEFKDAATGIKTMLKGGKMSDHQKKAVRTVAMDAAIAVALTAVTGGFGSGLTGAVATAAHHFTNSLAKKIALNSVTKGLGHLTTVEEMGHLGHGISELLEHVVTAAEGDKPKKGDESDLVVAFVTKLVSDQLKDLDPDVLAEAIEDASKEGAESKG